MNCEAVFTTEENAQLSAAWAVQASDGALAPFSRDKLMLSLYKSCEHRETALGDAAALADTIIKKLAELAENGRVWSGTIAQVTQVALNRFDKAASMHYQVRHKA
ncbi:MAG TPA: hypothetical protein VLG27_00700 [Candidatus Saccharimonadia bacterium]|nr:hypothetical protein [Candidatus Saccharimonadia bacterium]